MFSSVVPIQARTWCFPRACEFSLHVSSVLCGVACGLSFKGIFGAMSSVRVYGCARVRVDSLTFCNKPAHRWRYFMNGQQRIQQILHNPHERILPENSQRKHSTRA